MALVFLDGVCVTLTAGLSKTARSLQISAASKQLLVDKLGNDGYSYLTLRNTLGIEFIKVQIENDEIVLTRAQGDSTGVTGKKGDCLCFEVTKLVLDAYNGNSEDDIKLCGITTKDTSFLNIIQNGCKVSINFTDSFKTIINDLTSLSNISLPNGTYENATITVQNGRITGVSTGKNIVYTGGSCCGED